MCTRHNFGYQAVCELGTVTATNDFRNLAITKKEEGKKQVLDVKVPTLEPLSPMTTIVEALVNSLETGERTQADVHVARADTEILFGFAESQSRGRARVELPLGCSKITVPRPARPSIQIYGTNRLATPTNPWPTAVHGPK